MNEEEKILWRNGIVTDISRNKFFRSYAAKLKPRLVEEILSELSFSLLSMKIDSLIKYHSQNVLNQYCTTIIFNMVVNPKSPLNRVYSQNDLSIDSMYSNIEEDKDDDVFTSNESLELINDMKAFVVKRSEVSEDEAYVCMLFYRSFFGGETFQEISDSIGVTKTSVFNTVKEMQTLVQTTFKDRYQNVRNQ